MMRWRTHSTGCAWLLTLALTATAATGPNALTLCISAGGRVEIRPGSQPCIGCPSAACPNRPTTPPSCPADAGCIGCSASACPDRSGPARPDPEPATDDDCCYDVPLIVESDVLLLTRPDRDASCRMAAPPAGCPSGIEGPDLSAGSAGPDSSPPPPLAALRCLRSVVLLL